MSTTDAPPVVVTLIDEFLAEQGAATAVERFARAVETTDDAGRPFPMARRGGYWRDLMPATPPGPGQQYAFEVDLDACSGCKACVVACESLNGLDAGTSFRSVGTLVGAELPMVRNVTTACHHCVEPGCLSGCPVDAYEKDPVTGIVRHLDDQCIGCQYCTLTCPYEVPRFDEERGIVRKCDLCSDRLAEGETPACVNACPTEAISVRVVDVASVREAAAEPWGFSSPHPGTTVPATRFRTSEDLVTGVVAADAAAVATAAAHLPLTVMLVLTQVAVGTLVLLAAVRAATLAVPDLAAMPAAVTAVGTAVTAMAASVLHLGRPQYAWKAVIGLRHSWLSREIVAFSGFAPLATAYAAALTGWGPVAGYSRELAVAASATGLVAVFTSAKVYAVTGRRWWGLTRTLGRFLATTTVGGLTTLLAVLGTVGAVTGVSVATGVRFLAAPATVTALGIVAAELALLRRHRGPASDELARTARILVRQLPGVVGLRIGGVLAGGAVLPWVAWRMLVVEPVAPVAAAVTLLLGLALVLSAELAERWRFFTAVAPVRMPGRLP